MCKPTDKLVRGTNSIDCNILSLRGKRNYGRVRYATRSSVPHFWREIFSFISRMCTFSYPLSFPWNKQFPSRFHQTTLMRRVHLPAERTCYPFAARALSIFRGAAEGFSRVRSARIDRTRPLRFFIRHFIFIILPPQERDREQRGGRLKPLPPPPGRSPIPIASTHRRRRRRVSRIMCAYGATTV